MKTIKDFTEMIRSGENFAFVKQGDGEVFCMLGAVGENCDFHPYSKELGDTLTNAYTLFNGLDNVYVTKWTDFEIEGDYVRSKGNVSGEMFLHNSVSDDKYEFFKTLKESPRKKVYIGPARLREVINFLNVDEYVEVPEINAFSYKFNVEAEDDAIYLFSAGMPAKGWIAKLILNNPNITCIDIGSGLDPIFVGQTRTRQYGQKFLRDYYENLLTIPKTIFTIWLSDKEEIPPAVKACYLSQQLEGYEHKLITLENCYRNKYIQDAIDAKQWGKACDYLRCYYLIKEGGIYLDADILMLPGKNFDRLLYANMFAAHENNGFINTAVLGAKRGSKLLIDHLKEVEEKFKGNDGKYFESSIELFTPRYYDATKRGEVLLLHPEFFYPYDHQKNTINITNDSVCLHLFLKTWV